MKLETAAQEFTLEAGCNCVKLLNEWVGKVGRRLICWGTCVVQTIMQYSRVPGA